MSSRKDSRGRVLQKGESQRKDGRYQFAYTDLTGKRKFIYSKDLRELREKEREYHIANWKGAGQFGSKVSLNFMYDRSLALKIGIKESTYASYRQTYDNHVRDDFGRQLITNIRFSDIQAYYSFLHKEKNLSATSVNHVHTQVYGAFQLALQDGVIVKNPAEGAFRAFKEIITLNIT